MDNIIQDIFHHHEALKVSTAPITAQASTTFGQKVDADLKKFVSVLDLVGRDAEKGLVFAQKYGAPLAPIVALAFGPAVGTGYAGGLAAVDLVQQAVLTVKAQSATLPAGLTPAQMTSQELQIVGPAVIALVNKEFPSYSTANVQSLIALVIAAINAPPVTA
jgi:hypothetical protein